MFYTPKPWYDNGAHSRVAVQTDFDHLGLSDVHINLSTCVFLHFALTEIQPIRLGIEPASLILAAEHLSHSVTTMGWKTNSTAIPLWVSNVQVIKMDSTMGTDLSGNFDGLEVQIAQVLKVGAQAWNNVENLRLSQRKCKQNNVS